MNKLSFLIIFAIIFSGCSNEPEITENEPEEITEKEIVTSADFYEVVLEKLESDEIGEFEGGYQFGWYPSEYISSSYRGTVENNEIEFEQAILGMQKKKGAGSYSLEDGTVKNTGVDEVEGPHFIENLTKLNPEKCDLDKNAKTLTCRVEVFGEEDEQDANYKYKSRLEETVMYFDTNNDIYEITFKVRELSTVDETMKEEDEVAIEAYFYMLADSGKEEGYTFLEYTLPKTVTDQYFMFAYGAVDYKISYNND